jgi:hypothetical protein
MKTVISQKRRSPSMITSLMVGFDAVTNHVSLIIVSGHPGSLPMVKDRTCG